MSTFWTIVLRILWVGVVLVSSVITLLMFAFADSPDAGKAAQKMLAPMFISTLVLFAGGAVLMRLGTWWSIPCGFAAVILPPVLVFIGYNLLMK